MTEKERIQYLEARIHNLEVALHALYIVSTGSNSLESMENVMKKHFETMLSFGEGTSVQMINKEDVDVSKHLDS